MNSLNLELGRQPSKTAVTCQRLTLRSKRFNLQRNQKSPNWNANRPLSPDSSRSIYGPESFVNRPNTFQAAADLIRSHVSPKNGTPTRHSGRKERNLFLFGNQKIPPDGASFLELLRTLIIYGTLLIVNYSVSNLNKSRNAPKFLNQSPS